MRIPDAVVPALLRLTQANKSFRTAEGARQAIQNQALRPADYNPPKKLRTDVDISVRGHAGYPVYTVTPKRIIPTAGVVYIHGGAWLYEIRSQHWALIAQIAAEAGVAVTVPIYPLLPWGDARVVNELVVQLFSDLVDRYGDVRLAGDSAGGQIALSAAQVLRDRGVDDVRTVLISPVLDLSLSNPGIPAVLPRDPWLGVDGLRVLAEMWAAGLPVDDPRVSPLVGDMRGLGPMMVLSGTRDILNPDAHLLEDKGRAAGVTVTFIEKDDGVHVFPLVPSRTGADARRRIVAALRPR
ncbi:alpha/beta hydrolase fold domain-containing protein [Mycolicibacterium sp. A43C]